MGDPAVERAPAYWLFPVGAVVAGAGYSIGFIPAMAVGALILAVVALRLMLPSE
jgi:hypothetical protein